MLTWRTRVPSGRYSRKKWPAEPDSLLVTIRSPPRNGRPVGTSRGSRGWRRRVRRRAMRVRDRELGLGNIVTGGGGRRKRGPAGTAVAVSRDAIAERVPRAGRGRNTGPETSSRLLPSRFRG